MWIAVLGGIPHSAVRIPRFFGFPHSSSTVPQKVALISELINDFCLNLDGKRYWKNVAYLLQIPHFTILLNSAFRITHPRSVCFRMNSVFAYAIRVFTDFSAFRLLKNEFRVLLPHSSCIERKRLFPSALVDRRQIKCE